MSRKLLGHCSICDVQVAEITHQYPQSHPYAGDPMRLGKFYDNALRATLVLTNGSMMDVTICSDCESSLETSTLQIWDRVVAGWKLEISDKHRVLLNLKPYTESQKEDVNLWFVTACGEPPVGVLCVRPWKDVDHG